MTTANRAAARRMVQWHGRFSGLFGRKESREHSLLYVKGLLSNLDQSVEPIALHFSRGPDGGAATQNEVVALQGFVTASPWKRGMCSPKSRRSSPKSWFPVPRMVDRHGGRDRRVGVR